jgi:hypothetical protein
MYDRQAYGYRGGEWSRGGQGFNQGESFGPSGYPRRGGYGFEGYGPGEGYGDQSWRGQGAGAWGPWDQGGYGPPMPRETRGRRLDYGEGWNRGYDEQRGDDERGGSYGQTGPGYDRGWSAARESWSPSGYQGGFSGYEGGRYSGRGPKGYQRTDERIREEVCERLTDHGGVDACDIEVDVHAGEVTLRGTAPDRWQKRMAEDAIGDLPGVRDVHNQLRIDGSEHTTHGARMDASRPPSATTQRGRTDQPTHTTNDRTPSPMR